MKDPLESIVIASYTAWLVLLLVLLLAACNIAPTSPTPKPICLEKCFTYMVLIGDPARERWEPTLTVDQRFVSASRYQRLSCTGDLCTVRFFSCDGTALLTATNAFKVRPCP